MNDSTTAGKSYAYHIPGPYTGQATRAYSQYSTEGGYNTCRDGGITPPTPVSVIPASFYKMRPHEMPLLRPPPSSTATGYYSPYAVISQQMYTCGGLANAPEFCLGFNDISGNGCS